MSTFQMIMLGLAALVGGSTVWPQIKVMLSKLATTAKPAAPKIVPPVSVIEDNGGHKHECDDDSLCSLVVCWESLRDELHERGLYQAEAEVDKIFPLFVKESPVPSPAPAPAPTPVDPSQPSEG